MGFSMFQVKKGINLDGLAQVMTAAGVPGAAGDASMAPVGSLYLDVTNGQLYVKKTDGVGTDKWRRTQNTDDMADALNGISWREPVLVRDNTLRADLAAAVTAANVADTVDGQTISAGVRLLLDNVTGSPKNVYVVSGSTGAWTFTEDANALTKGDAVYVNAGTDAGKTFNYNDTVWVQQGGASATEISFIKNFVGKSADGSETPDYNTNHVVTDGDSLEGAIGDLDAEIGAGIATPQSRSIGAISDQAINLNLEALDDAIGATVTSTQHISSSNDLNSNVSILDKVLAYARTEKKSDSVTTLTTLDTFLVDAVLGAEWTVHARSAATASNIWAGKILVIHDGTASADAASVDYNIFAILKTGSAIPAINFECDLDGVGAAQALRLRASSGEAVHISLTRMLLTVQ